MDTIERAKAICILGALILALSGCRDSIKKVGGYECADFVRAQVYYGRPPSVRMAEIRGYSVEKQYAVFICGTGYIRPPSWDGAQPFIERGGLAIGFLKAKLQSAGHDFEISGIVALIDEMDELGSYPASNDKELMQILETSVARIRDPQLRRESEKRLHRIREAEHARTRG